MVVPGLVNAAVGLAMMTIVAFVHRQRRPAHAVS
jgi:hypothetical protein